MKLGNDNLDISTYSYDDLLKVLHLPIDRPCTIADLGQAKKLVLQMHPDKSHLPSEYFLFYKRALDVVVGLYQQNMKVDQEITESNTTYHHPASKHHTDGVTKTIQKMDPRVFQTTFNSLFETTIQSKPDASKCAWFHEQSQLLDIPVVRSMSDMNRHITTVKEQQKQNTMHVAKYQGVKMLEEVQGSASNWHGEQNEDVEYIASNTFSKLKYDDLRRVHRDETVFAVSERDWVQRENVKTMRQNREAHILPLTKDMQAQEEEDSKKQQWMQREYQSKMQIIENEEKNKRFLSRFLMLKG